MMQESIQGGTGKNGVVGEDLPPLTEGFIGSNDDSYILLVAIADDFEEHGGLVSVQTEITHFVDDQELWLGQAF